MTMYVFFSKELGHNFVSVSYVTVSVNVIYSGTPIMRKPFGTREVS